MFAGSRGRQELWRMAKAAKARSKVIASSAVAFALALAAAGTTGCSDTVLSSDTNAGGSGDAERPEIDLTFSNRDLDPSYDESTATKVTLTGDGATIDGEGATASGSAVTFSQAATYIVSGTLDNGQLIVDAGDQDKLQIVLADASVHNESGPALLIENADKCFLTLADGTSNSISDGTSYTTAEDDNADAAIFSRDDLTINGSGTLEVNGNYKHAIVSKDDLVITGGLFSVSAIEDAFQGKDALKIADGQFTVEAGDDAFHSEYLFYAKGGTIDVITCTEGYEGEKVIIDGGEHSIYATDDALNAAAPESDTANDAASGTAGDAAGNAPSGAANGAAGDAASGDMPGLAEGASQDGFDRRSPGSDMMPQDGEAPQGSVQGERPEGGAAAEGFTPDAKGREAEGFAPDSDAESRFAPNADADAQGAERGFEGGPAEGGRMGDGPGAMPASSEECLIQINGGTLNITGLNDAIDSNGNLEINGGTLLVCGPSQGMDGAFTFDLEAQINGGNMLMLGSMDSTKGMDESAQAWSCVQASGKAGSTVKLLDANGNVLLALEAALDFREAIVSSPSIPSGSEYTIQIDGTDTVLTMD